MLFKNMSEFPAFIEISRSSKMFQDLKDFIEIPPCCFFRVFNANCLIPPTCHFQLCSAPILSDILKVVEFHVFMIHKIAIPKKYFLFFLDFLKCIGIYKSINEGSYGPQQIQEIWNLEFSVSHISKSKIYKFKMEQNNYTELFHYLFIQ